MDGNEFDDNGLGGIGDALNRFYLLHGTLHCLVALVLYRSIATLPLL